MVEIFTELCESVGLSSTHLHCSNPGKKEDVKKKPFRAAFHRHEEGDGAYVKLGSRHQGAPNPVVHSAYIESSPTIKQCTLARQGWQKKLDLSSSLLVSYGGGNKWNKALTVFFSRALLQFFDALLETLNGIPSCFWWWWRDSEASIWSIFYWRVGDSYFAHFL